MAVMVRIAKGLGTGNWAGFGIVAKADLAREQRADRESEMGRLGTVQ